MASHQPTLFISNTERRPTIFATPTPASIKYPNDQHLNPNKHSLLNALSTELCPNNTLLHNIRLKYLRATCCQGDIMGDDANITYTRTLKQNRWGAFYRTLRTLAQQLDTPLSLNASIAIRSFSTPPKLKGTLDMDPRAAKQARLLLTDTSRPMSNIMFTHSKLWLPSPHEAAADF